MVSFGGAEQWELDLYTAGRELPYGISAEGRCDDFEKHYSTSRWTHLSQSFATSLRAIINILEIRRLHPEAAGWIRWNPFV